MLQEGLPKALNMITSRVTGNKLVNNVNSLKITVCRSYVS